MEAAEHILCHVVVPRHKELRRAAALEHSMPQHAMLRLLCAVQLFLVAWTWTGTACGTGLTASYS